MMTIVVLTVLLAYYPHVNKKTLQITSIVGLLIGVGNLWLEFIYLPELFCVGVLHIQPDRIFFLGRVFVQQIFSSKLAGR